MKIDFTSGEKRGLIALLVLLTAILGMSVGMRMCSSFSGTAAPSLPPRDSATAEVDTASSDTTLIFNSSGRPRKKKKASAPRTQRPDGPQRSFLDEPVEQ